MFLFHKHAPTVLHAQVRVAALEGMFASAANWEGVPETVGSFTSFNVNASLVPRLSFEGAKGNVVFVALYDDGHREGLQLTDGLEVGIALSCLKLVFLELVSVWLDDDLLCRVAILK